MLVDELGDLTLIDSEEYGDYSEGEMYTDVYGNVHEKLVRFRGGRPGSKGCLLARRQNTPRLKEWFSQERAVMTQEL